EWQPGALPRRADTGCGTAGADLVGWVFGVWHQPRHVCAGVTRVGQCTHGRLLLDGAVPRRGCCPADVWGIGNGGVLDCISVDGRGRVVA
ncbi:hypothetical protein NYY90_20110, partial [Acinetobacter baumannii]|nr:hypothetical protein [Acinetobacter baumannii]